MPERNSRGEIDGKSLKAEKRLVHRCLMGEGWKVRREEE